MMTLLALLFLDACLPAAGPRITAGDLAGAVPAFAALAPETPLAWPPAPGVERVVESAEMARWAERHGLALDRPMRVCFLQPAQPLDRQRVEAALRQAAPDWQIELLDWPQHPAGRGFPPGELRFDRRAVPRPARGAVSVQEALAAGVSPAAAVAANLPTAVPAVIWRGVLKAADGRQYPVWARVRLACERTALATTRAIATNEPVAEADVRLVTLAEHPLWPPPLASVTQLSSQRARRTLRAGQILRVQDLAPRPAVQRGDRLHVSSAAGSTVIHVETTAETNAGTGQILLLKNPVNGRRFQARVTGPGQATAITTNP